MAEMLVILWVMCILTFIFAFTAGYTFGCVRQKLHDDQTFEEFMNKVGGWDVDTKEINTVYDLGGRK